MIDAERQELNQHARDYLLAESLRNKYKKRMTPEEVAALEQEGETIARKEKPLSQDEFTDLQNKYLAQQEKPLESKTMGTPEGQAIVNTTKPANTLGQALNIIKKQHFNKLNPVEKILQNLFETLPNVLKGKYKVMGMPKR